MVNAAPRPYASESLSTKALAAAGQFRAIALWLNAPLIPQGIYAQVQPDKRPGCLCITLEFEREPQQQPLIKFVCHLIWQLNSPLIEGIHLIARPVGHARPLWTQRIRIMTPALKAQLHRAQGKPPLVSPVPPRLVPPPAPSPSGFSLQGLFSEQLKTLRAFILTGSAVAAFVLGCLVEVGLSSRPEPSLPFAPQAEPRSREAHQSRPPEPSAPTLLVGTEPTEPAAATPSLDQGRSHHATPIAGKAVKREADIEPEKRDRPRAVNAALEPVGVIQHDRSSQPTDPTVTLVFGGGVSLDTLPYSQMEEATDLLSELPIYQTADLAMVHLRDPLATTATSLEESLHNRKRPEAVDWLKAGGVDIIDLAGEEVLSGGEQSLAETLDLLDSHGIYRVGAGRTEREARRPEIVDVKGQRIAYLSYDLTPDQGAYDDVGGSNFATLPEIAQDIRAIRDQVDWLVVNYHWTGTYPRRPADAPENLARLAIDQGADLVLGHHPNKLQGAELYKGRPIVYSLGDFVYGKASDRISEHTAMLQVSLRGSQMKVEMIPLKVKQGKPQRASGHEATQVWEKIRDASQDFEVPMPPSIILDMRSRTPSDGIPAATEAGFTTDPAKTSPQENESANPSSTDTAPNLIAPADHTSPNAAEEQPTANTNDPEERDRPLPSKLTETDNKPEDKPEDDDILFEVEIDEFPKEMLKDWGPKQGSGTLYQPESTVPDSLRPAPLQSGQQPLPEPPPTAAPSHPQPTPEGAIAPYREPLLGPLSDRVLPDKTQKPNPVAWALPESRVFQPLNSPSVDPADLPR